MSAVRAVFFDFGGTLYDYRSLETAERESLQELLRSAGVEIEPAEVLPAHREALRRVFRSYLPRPFYTHRDLFRDAVVAMTEALGARPGETDLERYHTRRQELHERDFRLRDGVCETLREIRRLGFHLGLVSNIDEDQLSHLGRIAGLGERFDSILSSEKAGSCKPDPAIFEKALEQADCAPGEALFVGDSIDQDVAGAKRAGLRAVLLWHRDDRDVPEREPRPDHVIRRIPEILAVLDGVR